MVGSYTVNNISKIISTLRFVPIGGHVVSYLVDAAGLLPVALQLLPQPIILHQQQLYLAGLLQASRGQCVVAQHIALRTVLAIPTLRQIDAGAVSISRWRHMYDIFSFASQINLRMK